MSESTLKSATLETMNGLLSPDQNIRKSVATNIYINNCTVCVFVCLSPSKPTIVSRLPKFYFKLLPPGENFNGATLLVSQLEQGGACCH